MRSDTHSPYDPASLLIGIDPRKKKMRVHTKTGRWMFIAASLLIAKNWEQPKCVKQWMYEQRVVQAHWNIHQLGWCSGESCGTHSTPWIHVQGFSETGKTAEAKQGGGGLLQRDIREFLGVMEVLCQCCGDGTTVYSCQNSLNGTVKIGEFYFMQMIPQ